MKSWVKLYTEINRDPKIGTLTWSQRGILSALFALCGEIDDRDDDEQETGVLDTLDNVAWHLRCDREELSEAVAAFTARGIVELCDGLLVLSHYPDRQGRAPTARPSAVRERVKRWREQAAQERDDVAAEPGGESDEVTTSEKRACNDVTAAAKRGVTSSDSETERETERDADAEETHTSAHTREAGADAPPSSSPSSHTVSQELLEAAESVFGRLKPVDLRLLRQYVELYGAEEVAYALDESLVQRKRAWSYVRAILERRAQDRLDEAELAQDPAELSDSGDSDADPEAKPRDRPACAFDQWDSVRAALVERGVVAAIGLQQTVPKSWAPEPTPAELVVVQPNPAAREALGYRSAAVDRVASEALGRPVSVRWCGR